MNKYDDIINLPHHESKYYKRMSLEERSAQFAPFDALEGYSEEVHETERLTSKRIKNIIYKGEFLNGKRNGEGSEYIYNQLIILLDSTKIPINEIIDIKLCYNEEVE